MPDVKWKDIRDGVTFAASLLAITLASVSFYFSRTDPKIAAAVELSLKNLSGEVAGLRNDYGKAVQDPGTPPEPILESSAAYIHYLEYVAKLINDKLIDQNYVSDAVKCQIIQRPSWSAGKPWAVNGFPTDIRNIVRFQQDNTALRCEAKQVGSR